MDIAFRDRYALQAMVVLYSIVFLVGAIRPYDRRTWAVENILVWIGLPVLYATYPKLPLSDLSYLSITVFLLFHSVGAHYTYSRVPLGHWLKKTFRLRRNHYDRFVHALFGLCAFVPLQEVFVRTTGLAGFWSYFVPFAVILSASALFEVLEFLVALVVAPGVGNAYLGAQGDPWDAQKDIVAAFFGATLAGVVRWVVDFL